jgi:glycosyltransferase involved in cell wall biosynthesis
MLVSIIIPTFNRAHTLQRAIDSVLEQTYTNWELIIIDNHSTDKTDSLIASFQNSKINYLKISNDGIIAKSRNLGIKKSKGEIIAFLDSDDWWTKDKLKISLMGMKKHGADLIYHNLFKAVKDNQAIYWSMKVRKLKGNIFEDLLTNGNCIPNSSVVVKKWALEKIGYLCENPETRTWEDYDAWLQISKYTNKFHRIKNTLGYLWLGGGNESLGRDKDCSLDQLFKNITYFEIKYFQEIEYNINVNNVPWWINYQRGKSLFKLKRMDDSLAYFKNIQLLEVPYLTLLKIVYMTMLSKLHKYVGN